MNRLTYRVSESVADYVGRHRVLERDTASEMRKAAIREVMTRLAEYEDTGLTPEQIKVMHTEVKNWRKTKNVRC